MKDYKRADAAYVEALDIRKEILGGNHPDTITAMNNLAECKRAAGDENGALKIQGEILQILGVVVEDKESNTPEDSRKLL